MGVGRNSTFVLRHPILAAAEGGAMTVCNHPAHVGRNLFRRFPTQGHVVGMNSDLQVLC